MNLSRCALKCLTPVIFRRAFGRQLKSLGPLIANDWYQAFLMYAGALVSTAGTVQRRPLRG